MHPDALAARLACILLGYLFGSFLTAEVVARVVSGKSARRLGTGNPGMANIMAQLGKGAGLLTLAGDTLKTVAACGAAYYATAPLIGQASILYAGLGAVLGHNYPAWAGFRGGKGVAVTCGWLVLYLPFWALLHRWRGTGPVARLPAVGGCGDPSAGHPARVAFLWPRKRHSNFGPGHHYVQPPLPRPAADSAGDRAPIFPTPQSKMNNFIIAYFHQPEKL